MKSSSDKVKEYLEKVEPHFSGIRMASSFSLYSGEFPTSGNIQFSGVSKAFKTKFNLDNKQTFIHYTSIDTMVNIINTKNIRMYNCANLNDSLEMEFALKEQSFQISKEDLQSFKDYTFLLSGCKYNVAENDEDFSMWRFYGNSGKGVGMVFEIENVADDWQGAFMNDVYYGKKNEQFKDFLRFLDFHNDFQKENQLFQNIPYFIPAYAFLFKDEIWSVEKEIRLFAYCGFDKYFTKNHLANVEENPYLNKRIEHGINGSGKAVSYVNLPLNINEEKEKIGNSRLTKEEMRSFFSTLPHLKLKRIVLGYDIPEKTFNNLVNYIHFVAVNKLGYSIDIVPSRLKESL